METDRITAAIIGGAIKVHSALGPGLMESAYKACLRHELRTRALHVQAELPIPVHYDGLQIDVGYRIDLLVEGVVVVELKAVTRLLPIHSAQLLSYLKLTRCPVGLLINFHVTQLRLGIKRMVT